MELWDAGGTNYLSIEPMSYQFEDVRVDPYDANWLLIDGRARWGSEEWNFLDPCLLVEEALNLGTWLTRAAHGLVEPIELSGAGALQPTISHVEPNLGFGLVSFGSAAVVLRVFLWLESQPPRVTSDMEFFMDLTIAPRDLKHAVAAWQTELAEFPLRG
ncbi:MAG: WapI family immunity protein [Rhodoglobus sp.]